MTANEILQRCLRPYLQSEFRIAVQNFSNTFFSMLLRTSMTLMEPFLVTGTPTTTARSPEIRMTLNNNLGIDTQKLCAHVLKAVANGLIRRAKMDKTQSRTREFVKNDQLLMFSLIVGIGFPNPQETLRNFISEN
eukprot:GHVP01061207.1.p1 GENE.GHVP01061207.1~~GHVP01061207.1.p1  ORF type:complete len:135 (+),score=6.29 GHVP01061207.1:472-876(+)